MRAAEADNREALFNPASFSLAFAARRGGSMES
jgi:hypothetical protein